VLLAVASLRTEGAASLAASHAAAHDAVQVCGAESRGQRDVEEEFVDAKCKATALKVLLHLLSADTVRGAALNDSGSGELICGAQEFERALHLFVRIVFTIEASHDNVRRELEEGVMVCIITAFRLVPSCLTCPALQSACIGHLLDYTSSFAADEDERAKEAAHQHDPPQGAPCDMPPLKSASGLGRALVALNCLIASHLNGSLSKEERNHRCGAAEATDRLLQIFRVYCRLALHLTAAPSRDERARGAARKPKDRGESLAHAMKKRCGLYGGIGLVGDVLLCRGVGSMGLVLAAVVRGSDRNTSGEWLAAALDYSPEFVDSLEFPNGVLCQAQDDMRKEGGGRMLRMLAAVCQCGVLAGKRSEVPIFREIFRRGSKVGRGVFLDLYNPDLSSEEECVPAAMLKADRHLMWETLFSCQRHLTALQADSKVLIHVVSATAGVILHSRGDTEGKLEVCLEAHVVRVLLDGARHGESRGDALLALSELVGLGGSGKLGISRHPRLWALLEDTIIGPATSSCEPSEDGVKEVLAVCRPQPTDSDDGVWCAFNFVMCLLMRDRFPRICSLLSAGDDRYICTPPPMSTHSPIATRTTAHVRVPAHGRIR